MRLRIRAGSEAPLILGAPLLLSSSPGHARLPLAEHFSGSFQSLERRARDAGVVSPGHSFWLPGIAVPCSRSTRQRRLSQIAITTCTWSCSTTAYGSSQCQGISTPRLSSEVDIAIRSSSRRVLLGQCSDMPSLTWIS
ncbi:hypothetical protein OH77DRAFT_272679 [Trametes cingulata]|nr:hypothetical protein OH77DRAFT_272679 [Trametes cingulata]